MSDTQIKWFVVMPVIVAVSCALMSSGDLRAIAASFLPCLCLSVNVCICPSLSLSLSPSSNHHQHTLPPPYPHPRGRVFQMQSKDFSRGGPEDIRGSVFEIRSRSEYSFTCFAYCQEYLPFIICAFLVHLSSHPPFLSAPRPLQILYRFTSSVNSESVLPAVPLVSSSSSAACVSE